MKGIILFTLFAIGMTASAQRVNFGNHQLSINGDDMTWLLQTDGSQYEWVTDKYQWGNAYYDADGDIAVKTERRQEGDDLVETYVFTNTSSGIGSVGQWYHKIILFQHLYPAVVLFIFSVVADAYEQ